MTEKTRRAWFFWGILATSAEVGLGRGQRLLGHVGDVTAATLTAPVTGEDYALSTGDDGTIRSWRLQLGQGVPHGMAERNQRSSALVTSSLGDLGQVVITGGVDGQLRIWSLRDGSTVGKPLSGNGYAVQSLESNGTCVGVLHQNCKLRIWDLATGDMFTEITQIEACTFTAVDGRLAVAVRTVSNALEVYDLSRSQWCGKPTPLDGQSHDYASAPILSVNSADNRGGVTSLLRTHSFRQTGQFSMVFTASDVCGASPNQQALRTFCLLRASFPPPSF